MNSMSRRRFLKISGGTIAAAAVINGTLKPLSKGVEKINKKKTKGIKRINVFLEMQRHCNDKRW